MIPAAPVRLAMSLACIALLTGWMIGNVLDPLGGSLHLDRLAGAIALAACISIERRRRDRLVLKTWSVPLGVFLLLYVGRWVADVGDLAAVKAATVATSGGVLLFLGLGVMSAIVIESAVDAGRASRRMIRVAATAWSAMILVALAIVGFQCWGLRQGVHSNLAMVDLEGRYQRPGNLLVMFCVVFAYGTFAFVRSSRASCRIAAAVMASATPPLAIASGILAQLLGSNIALAILSGLAILTIASLIAAPVWARRARILRAVNRFVLGMFVAIIAIALISGTAMQLLSIDPSSLRITGFGSGSIRSVESRIELWRHFPTHFLDSPLLGNMNVDVEMTGTGSYVHSLAGMLLTHTGIVGFMLFFSTIVLALRSLTTRPARPAEPETTGRGRAEGLFLAALLAAFVAAASLGTAISWAPLWFVLGLAAPPLVFTPRRAVAVERLPVESLR